MHVPFQTYYQQTNKKTEGDKTMRQLTIGIDVDDVLFECVPIAIRIVNEQHGTRIRVEDIEKWNFENFSTEVKNTFLDVMGSGIIFAKQKPLPGSDEMVNALLSRGHEVVFISAVEPRFMGIRADQLIKSFSMVPEKNIMLGFRKDLVHLDVLLDDAIHNLTKTRAEYPVAFSQPWNASLTGFLTVNDYQGFVSLIDQISATKEPERRASHGKPVLIALVGPSGSGKTEIAKELCKSPAFGEALSHTTREQRPCEGNDYHFVAEEEFERIEMNTSGFIDTTVYAGKKYGLRRGEIHKLWDAGKHAVTPVDISGAMRLKQIFGDRVITAFVRREKQAVITEIVSRDVPPDDKVNRIMSLNTEYDNEGKCDFVLLNNSTIENAASQIVNYINSGAGA